MIRGERVLVWRLANTGVDPFGGSVKDSPDGYGSGPYGVAPYGESLPDDWDVEEVFDVLVAPASRADAEGSVRPSGTKIAWQLHFPKTYLVGLRGAFVQVRSDKPRPVVGDPRPYTVGNTPGRWNLPVELEDVDG